jgi:hypothetical protein
MGPVEVKADVGEVLVIFGVAQPAVDDAVAADEGFAAIDHDDLAVVAVVEYADVSERPRVKETHVAAGVTHLLRDVFADALGPLGIEQHTHLDLGARPLDQCLGQAAAELAVLPEKGLEVDGLASRADPCQQHVEESAVLEHIHPVARRRCAQREARQAGHQLVDG